MTRSLIRFAALAILLTTPRLHDAQERPVKVEQQKAFSVIGLAVRNYFKIK